MSFAFSVNARPLTHNDLPTIEDKLGRAELVQQVAWEIAASKPPLVFGIDGDWGSGKTSFLCQLEHELTGLSTICPEDRKRVCDIQNVFTVWFEAWRYQHEPSPAVALLHEICQQLPKHKKIRRALTQWGTMITKGFFGAIDELSLEIAAAPLGAGAKAGVKLKNPLHTVHEAGKAWEEERLAGPLNTERVRELLMDAIGRLLGAGERRVCVIIDDLDRCDPSGALRLIEAIKIYLSLPQCVFVLGVNIRQIERAIAPLLPGAGDKADAVEKRIEAAEYLEKLCTFAWKLPFPSSSAKADLLRLWLADPAQTDPAAATPVPGKLRDNLVELATKFDCLPPNPRKIKSLANAIRQLAAHASSGSRQPQGTPQPPQGEAAALLVAATIYQFHPELLRYLQTSADAWTELVLWVNGKSALPRESDLLKTLQTLRPLTVAAADAGKSPTPSGAGRVSLFADPTHLNVFRIEELLRKVTGPEGSVGYDAMRRFLDLPRSHGSLTGTPAGRSQSGQTS